MRPTARPLIALVLVGAALVAVAVLSSGPARTPSRDLSISTTVLSHPGSGGGGVTSTSADVWADGVVDERDGVVPDGVTVFDDAYPGVANLDLELLRALRAAATDSGMAFEVHSAWRSPEYQEQLLMEAIAEHGSEEEASRWVAPPDLSLHVTGDAADIAGDEARAWLADHGARYGLCRTYGNEPWHFELRPDAVDEGCPPVYADPTEDPRLQR